MYFYDTFKWLARLGKISGHLPVQNVFGNDATLLHYKVFSKASFYAIFLYSGCLVLAEYLSVQFQFDVQTRFHQLLRTLVLSMLIRSMFSFGFCLYHHSKRIPRVIKLLDFFDRQRDPVVVRTPHCKFFYIFYGVVLPLALNSVFSFVYFKESSDLMLKIYALQQVQFPREFYWLSYLFGLCSVWHFLPPLYFIYFAIKICTGFHQINHTVLVKRYCVAFFAKSHKFDSNMGEALAKLRLLHNLLSEATYCLSRCYGGFMAFNTLFLIIAVVVNVSAYFCATKDGNLISLVVVDCLYFVATTFAGTLIHKRGVKVVRLFQGIPTSDLSEKSKEEIQLWLLQLTAHPIQVNAGGYFILDKSQTFEALSSIATYLIVAVQLLQDGKFS